MKLIATFLITIFGLSACATNTMRETRETNRQITDGAQQNLDQLNRTIGTQKSKTIEEVHANWLGGHMIQTAIALPPAFSENITLSQDFENAQALADCLQNCREMPGIPVVLAPEVGGQAPQTDASASNPPPPIVPGLSAMPGPPGAPVQPGINAGGLGANAGLQQPIRLRYKGTFTGLLNTIANKLGDARWKYSDGSIHFYNLESRTFVIDAIPGNSNTSAGVSGGSSGASGSNNAGSTGGGASGGSSSGSGPSTSISSNIALWDDIKSMMPIILSPSGKFFLSPAMGTITITDKPKYLDRAAEKIADLNHILSMQALIQVKVYKITLNQGDQYGLNWNLIFNNLSKTTGLTFANAFPTQGNTGSFAINILKTAGDSNPHSNLAQIAGSQAMINALSTQGDTTLLTSSSVTTTNNRPAPLKVGNTISYPASSSTTTTANVGSTSAVIAATIQTGYIMTVLPHIIDDRRLFLQFAINLSSNTMDVETNQGITTKYPNLATIDLLQHVALNSGETLILSGFEQTNGNLNQQGIGSPSNWLLGGGINASKSKDIIIVMITPIIAEQTH